MTQQYHFWAYTLRKPDLKETRAPQCTSPFNYGGRVYVLSSLYIIKLHLCSHMALILRIGNSEAMRKAPDCPASSQGTVPGSICLQRPLTSPLCFLPFPHSCSLLGLGVQGRGQGGRAEWHLWPLALLILSEAAEGRTGASSQLQLTVLLTFWWLSFWGSHHTLVSLQAPRTLNKPRQHFKKQRHHFVDKGIYSQSYDFSGSPVWMWKWDYKEGWAPKNWCFWTLVLDKTLESPLDSREIKPVNPEGNQPRTLNERTYVETEAPILWPPDEKNWLTGKYPDAGKS